jgi:RND family efflux transporter MFP subunit
VKKLIVLLFFVGAVLAVGAYYNHWSTSEPKLPPRDAFKAARVEHGWLAEAVTTTGVVQPKYPAAVGSEASGRVVKIYEAADFNRRVEEGQALLQVDDRIPRRRLEQAEKLVESADASIAAAQASLDGARSALDYQKELRDKQTGVRAQFLEAEYKFKAAEAALKAARGQKAQAEAARDLAKDALDLTRVKSPIAGTIIDRKVVQGQLVGPAAGTLFTIVPDLKRVEVHAQVAEGDVAKLQGGQDAYFNVTDFANGTSDSEDKVFWFKGKVLQVRLMPVAPPSGQQGASFYTAIIDVQNEQAPATKEWRLRPGMSVSVDIIFRPPVEVWKLPLEAVDFELNDHYQTPEAKARLKKWEETPGDPTGKTIWIMTARGRPWPVQVKTGFKGRPLPNGSTTRSLPEYYSVLDWGDLQPAPDRYDQKTWPEVITEAPPYKERGLFELPKLSKVF